jgi:hypothetical protein
MKSTCQASLAAMGMLLGLSACSKDRAEPEACAEVDIHIPTVAHVNLVLDEPAWARVHVLDESGETASSTAWTEASSLEPQVHVMGLLHGTTAHLQPEIRWEDSSTELLETLDLDVPQLPVGFPQITAESFGEHDDGLVLTHTLSTEQSMVLIVDRAGNPVWYTKPGISDRILSVSRSLDGHSLWFAQHPTNYTDTLGLVHHIALDGSFYDVLEVERVHSGVAELPEGGFGYLRKLDEEFEDGVLLWDEIWEQDAAGVDRQIFSIRDHFEPEPLCTHWEMVDVESDEPERFFDWTHANSLVLSEDQSAWYLMVRHFDALLKIDRASGELLWTLSGPYSDFESDNEAATLSHPHFSQLIDGGLLVFDNGTHREPPSSRLVEIFFDEETMTVQSGEEVRAPGGQNIPELGDAIRNPAGNLMGSWTSLGTIEEYDDNIQTLWSLNLELGFYIGRITWMESLEP